MSTDRIKQRQCSVEECRKEQAVKGLCQFHYDRQKVGLPLITWKENFILRNPPRDGVGLIPLSNRKVAIVDENDYLSLISLHWYACKSKAGIWYAKAKFNNKSIYMHRFILSPNHGNDVDHINHNGLDNRRANIRIATRTQNMRNGRGWKKRKSYFKGVHSAGGKWKAQITVNGIRHNLGSFHSQEEAAMAYDVAAKSFFGEFAFLNNVQS